MRVAIIGAGLAGLTCGARLQALGLRVFLFDKGRGPGGRLATRRLETRAGMASFDHGAPALDGRGPDFRSWLESWGTRGAAAHWPEGGQAAWTGTPAMNSLPKAIARELPVTSDCFVRGLTRDVGGWHLVRDQGRLGPFDTVVIALPAEQAAPLLALQDLRMAAVAVSAPSAPCWSAMFALARGIGGPSTFATGEIVRFAACGATKPGRTGPEAWTVHACPVWSRRHLDDAPPLVQAALRDAFQRLVGRAALDIAAADVHRWRFGISGSAGEGALWNPRIGLGACGDWLIGPGAEAAWRSGMLLAGLIAGSG
ncbi:NAD(P)/FAD-dependent oxidoreductase [Sphingomonas sp. Sphisp140]|uniref:NAD(P)/FAD-dependent oxidoreductase n=1 Tax=unclassified Sphingomonas TaxID=196159 RepID=UPI0039B0EFF8